MSRFVPGRTNRVQALRADRDTAPAAGPRGPRADEAGAAGELQLLNFFKPVPRAESWLRDEQRAKDREQRQVANAQGKHAGWLQAG